MTGLLFEELETQSGREERQVQSAITIVDSLEAVARHFKKSLRQVRRWVKAGMPALSDGRFDLMQIAAWRARKQGIKTRAATPGGTVSPAEGESEEGKDFWDKEGKKYQAKTRELEYLKRKGELVERKEVESLFVDRIMAVRQGLLSLSRALPPQLVFCQNEREMEAVIARAIRDLLEAFARPLPQSLSSEDAHGTAGSPD